MQSRVVAVVVALVLAAADVGASRAEGTAGIAAGWGWKWPGSYGPYRYVPYGYGWIDPWRVCGAGACVDNPYLRRAIRRDLELHEHLLELQERSWRGLSAAATPPFGTRPDPLPPTPEAHMQPGYRGSGEILPEFSDAGQPLESFVGPQR